MTDGAQMLLAVILLGVVLAVLRPGLAERGLPDVSRSVNLAGWTLDSTFSSTAKLAARDWRNESGAADARVLRRGHMIIVLIAVLGNLSLLSIYLGAKAGPAVIAATAISGTMVMGLAPIFLLSFIQAAGRFDFFTSRFGPGLRSASS